MILMACVMQYVMQYVTLAVRVSWISKELLRVIAIDIPKFENTTPHKTWWE
jgi:hypothetical protein